MRMHKISQININSITLIFVYYATDYACIDQAHN